MAREFSAMPRKLTAIMAAVFWFSASSSWFISKKGVSGLVSMTMGFMPA